MSRKITLTTNNISHKQWATLILELNVMSKTWRRYGVNIKIKAPRSEKIIKWGNRSHDEGDIQPEIHT
jgi:hypothetical protein|tara:strand:+ start:495 stop:698 length:204 start_codon:yes stop_codon:yes gene_type:complete